MAEVLTPDGAVTTVSPEVRAAMLCGPYMGKVNLNIGCGRHPLRGLWINIDRVGGFGADVVCELGRDPLRVATSSVDCVFASHVLEHIPDIIAAMREIHRVLVPGGVLVACTPYAGSNGAWEDPTHVRAFTENSWCFFDQHLYEQPDQAGFYPSPVDYVFEVLKVDLIPEPDILEAVRTGALALDAVRPLMRRQRNIIQEIQAHLRARKDRP